MEVKKTIFGWRTVALAVIILGWALCAYLFFRYTQVKSNTGSNTTDFCKAILGSSCDTTLTSSVSWQLGAPLLGWGMAYFGLLALLFSFRNWVVDRFVLLLAAFGVGVSAILTALIFRNNLICPLCLVIHFINLVALITLFISTRSSISYRGAKPNLAWHSLLKWGFLLLVVIITGGFTEVRILKSFLPKMPEVNMDEVAKKFQSEKVYNFAKNDPSAHLGSNEAPVQLVVFSSFQCPACKGFASSIEDIQKKFGKNVGITFKNFPLSTTCNPRLSENMQPQSCDAAFAAIAAQRQNRFWEYHDQLFEANLADGEKALTIIAKNIGLNIEKWELDRKSNEAREQLAYEIKTAYKLGINATPSIFINGRKISNPNLKVLNFLIQNELNKISH